MIDVADIPLRQELPEPVFARLFAALREGKRVRTVANQLMQMPRGELEHLGHHDIRRRVRELREWIQLHQEELADGLELKLPAEYANNSKHWLREVEPEDLLLRLLRDQRSEYITARKHDDRATAATARRDILRIIETLCKWKHATGSNPWDDDSWDGPGLPDDFDRCPAEDSAGPPRTPGLKEALTQMDNVQRMLFRNALGKGLQILKLQWELAKLKAQEEANLATPLTSDQEAHGPPYPSIVADGDQGTSA